MTVYRTILTVIALCFSCSIVAAPKIVTTIAPVHSLVAAVAEGAGEVELLFPATRSPHGAGLRPSQVRALANAELVIRVDPLFELAVERVIGQQSRSDLDTRVLTLSKINGLRLLNGRDIAGHHGEEDNDSHSDSESDSDHHQHGGADALDPHLWLSTENASLIVGAVANRLATLDPDNAGLYHSNAVMAQNQIAESHSRIKDQLKNQNDGWLFFHDAYQYFEKEFELEPRSIVTTDPERAISGKRLRELASLIEQGKVSCIFIEPQLRPDLITRLAEKTGVTVLVIDPLGSDIAPGPALWFDLMSGLSRQLSSCQ